MTQDFFFVGGILALDFVNTEAVVRNKRTDLLENVEALQLWWQKALAEHPPVTNWSSAQPLELDEEVLQKAKKLRADLRHLLETVTSGQKIATAELEKLNQILGYGRPNLQLTAENKLQAGFEVAGQATEVVLFEIAHSALKLLTEKNLERLHKCQNNRCILLFYDTTKSATRHWCSLGCMNRYRSIQHYQESKNSPVG